jgi:nitronate monooxygenase
VTEIFDRIVLGAFGGASSLDLTAAVSAHGGLGSYGLYGYSAEQIAHTAAALRDRTDAPFVLNLWLPTGDEVAQITPDELEAYLAPLRPWFAEMGVEPPAAPPTRFLPSLNEQRDAVLAARPAAVSLVFGVPDAELVAAAHDRGIDVIATATTLDEAQALNAAGVDAIIASGAEAGGHRVSFMRPAEDSLVATAELVAQTTAAGLRVLAAGGIATPDDVRAMRELGAAGVVVGTAFLATDQSGISPGYRAVLRSERAKDTVLTRAMSGRLARGIPNRLMDALEAAGPAPFPVQNWLTGIVRREAARRDEPELLSLWASARPVPADSPRDAVELLRLLQRGL